MNGLVFTSSGVGTVFSMIYENPIMRRSSQTNAGNLAIAQG